MGTEGGERERGEDGDFAFFVFFKGKNGIAGFFLDFVVL
jgi:hypothetical protein